MCNGMEWTGNDVKVILNFRYRKKCKNYNSVHKKLLCKIRCVCVCMYNGEVNLSNYC